MEAAIPGVGAGKNFSQSFPPPRRPPLRKGFRGFWAPERPFPKL